GAAARRRVGAGAPAAAEHPAEQVAERAAGTGRGGAGARAAEQVAQVERETTRAALARWPEATAPEQGARVVVLLALLGVGQDVVRLGDLLEPLLRLGVALIGIGVILASKLPVGLLDLVRGRGLGDAQSLVIVLLEDALSAHWFLEASVSVPTVPPWPGAARPVGRARLVRLARRGGAGPGVVVGLGDDHPGRPDDPLANLVAGLQDLDTGRLGHPGGLGERYRLMHIRVERPPLGAEGDQTRLGPQRLHRP